MDKVIFENTIDYDEFDEKNKFGTTILVKRRIPMAKKKELAVEYCKLACVMDFDSGLANLSFDAHIIMSYLLCKYYTNINVEAYQNNMELLFDYVDFLNDMMNEDATFAMRYAMDYVDNVVRFYNERNTLAHRVKMSISGIVDGGDISDMIAKNTDVNNALMNLLDSVNNKQEDKVVMFPWAAKKNDGV